MAQKYLFIAISFYLFIAITLSFYRNIVCELGLTKKSLKLFVILIVGILYTRISYKEGENQNKTDIILQKN